jgi:hypothetical protein
VAAGTVVKAQACCLCCGIGIALRFGGGILFAGVRALRTLSLKFAGCLLGLGAAEAVQGGARLA